MLGDTGTSTLPLHTIRDTQEKVTKDISNNHATRAYSTSFQAQSFLCVTYTFKIKQFCIWNRKSVLGYRLEDPGFGSRQLQEISPFSKSPRPALRPIQPSIQWVPGSFQGVKLPGNEIAHSPSSSEVKNVWNCTSAPPICLQGVGRDQFTSTSL